MHKHFTILLSLFLLCSIAYGSLTDHLKKAEGKGDHHCLKNIDFIYMINLDERPEKFAVAKQYLDQYGITPYRFSAVNGWKLSVEAINDVGLKFQPGMTTLLATTFPIELGGKEVSHELTTEYGKTYFCHCTARGAIGCSLSHISVLKDAYDSGYNTIWVMEDDIEAIQDPHILSDLIDELDAVIGKENWDVLFTDVDYRIGIGQYMPASGRAKRPDMDCSLKARYDPRFTTVTVINDHFRKIAARFGTASMIIRRSGIKKLLEFSLTRNIYLPYDLENILPEGIQRYGLTFDVVTNMLHSLSDIGIPDYMNSPQYQEISGDI